MPTRLVRNLELLGFFFFSFMVWCGFLRKNFHNLLILIFLLYQILVGLDSFRRDMEHSRHRVDTSVTGICF